MSAMTPESTDDFNFCSESGEMVERLRSHDWQSSALGAPSSWPESLRVVLGVCFDSHFPIAVWWGPDLIQFYNDDYRPILGATKHPAAFGRAARESWPDIWPTIGPMVEQVMTQGEAVRGDDMYLALDRNGYSEACYFTFSYSPIRDINGKIVGMFTAAVETTARVFAERRQAFQLRLADRLRGLSTPDDITAAATELLGKYLNVSRTFYAEIDDATDTFNVPAKWIAVSNLPDLPASGRIEAFSPALLKSLRAGMPFVVDDIYTDKRVAPYAPTYAALNVHSVVIVPLVKSGRLRATFNVTETGPRRWAPDDISVVIDVAERTWDAIERARAEEALRIENDNTKRIEAALRNADRRKDDFLAMLAHELRNPLAPISAAADLLSFARLDEARIKKTSGIISRQVAHMAGLVDDLLDVSRVTRGLTTLEKVELSARHIVSDAVEQVRPLLAARRHHLSVRQPSGAALILGDRKRLVQVMSNLLNNAAKYTPEGGSITLKVEIQNEHILFSVADNGIGMEPELVERAFELFTQAERTADRSQGGLGIGLALVKSLVELHGGTVSGHSNGLGAGSEFIIRLPRLHHHQDCSLMGARHFSVAKAKIPLCIMVVDDNTDAAAMLAMFVEALGHKVFVEYQSKHALERARNLIPDVCLLDIGLPEMDGNELARQLRAIPALSNSVLIAVTGYGQPQDRENSFSAGFDHHFMKPVDTTKLAELLTEITVRK